MNLIEILATLQGLSRNEMWTRLEEMGVEYNIQEAIMKCVDSNGCFVTTEGREYRLTEFTETYDLPLYHENLHKDRR